MFKLIDKLEKIQIIPAGNYAVSGSNTFRKHEKPASLRFLKINLEHVKESVNNDIN